MTITDLITKLWPRSCHWPGPPRLFQEDPVGGTRAAHTPDVPGTLPEVTGQPPATRALTCVKSATSEAGAVTSSILQRETLSCLSEQQAQARRAERQHGHSHLLSQET